MNKPWLHLQKHFGQNGFITHEPCFPRVSPTHQSVVSDSAHRKCDAVLMPSHLHLCPRSALERRLPELNTSYRARNNTDWPCHRNSTWTARACYASCANAPLPSGCGFRRMDEDELATRLSGKRLWFAGDSLVGNVANHLQQTLLQRADARGNATLFFRDAPASWRTTTHASRRASFARAGADSNAFGDWCNHSSTHGCSYPTVGQESVTLFWPGASIALRTSDVAVVNAHGLWCGMRDSAPRFVRAGRDFQSLLSECRVCVALAHARRTRGRRIL